MENHIIAKGIANRARSTNVLLVDHHDDRREQVVNLLRECQDVTIQSTGSATGARTHLREHARAYGCLLIADQPPEEDVDLIEELRSVDESIPIITIAEQSISAERYERHLTAGASECIPISLDRSGIAVLRKRMKFWIALEQSKPYESALTDNTEFTLLLDYTGRIVFMSRAAESLVGVDAAALDGAPIEELVGSTHVDLAKQCVDAIQRGQEWEGTLTVEGEIGKPVDVRASATPIESVGDENVAGVLHGETHQDELDRTLRSFRKAVEHAGHVILITDPAGHIEYVNAQFEEVTGYSREEAIGKRPSILKSGEHSGEFYQSLWDTIHSGDVWQGEVINERKNGERYQIHQTIAPITDREGSIDRFVAVNADITERKRVNAQLRRERDRLEQFARTVSHDLRNPLAIALGHTELLAKQNEADEHLENVIAALERMDAMTDQLLTLSKQGETVQEPESVDLTEGIEQAWSFVSTSPNSSLQMDDAIHNITLTADRIRLCELLENLIDNAITHGGPDTVVKVGALPSKNGFYVADDGPGFGENNGYRIFESGFTTHEDGTGYGLAIVKQIVEAHGWTIEAGTDTQTGGARFDIVTEPFSESLE